MTAEIAIANRFGIALAADSAITVGNERVWKTSNKIYSLGPRHDIGIMIYGGGDFLGCPWETIIKSFQSHSKTKAYPRVEDCASEFTNYLASPKWSSPFEETVGIAYIFVKELEEYKEAIEYNTKLEFRAALSESVTRVTQVLERDRPIALANLTIRDFSVKYKGLISRLCREIFPHHVPDKLLKQIIKYLFEYIRRAKCTSGLETGVVICGFGSDEIYPSLIEYLVDGKYETQLRAWTDRSRNLNDNHRRPSFLIPFAQRDMTKIFMEGISFQYWNFFLRTIGGLLERKSSYLLKNFTKSGPERQTEESLQNEENKEILKEVGDSFQSLRNSASIQPLMASIRTLPREEMASMAEALVELTSLRRKIDSKLQSVAGPVDVAFISKGDGLVWIKRKSYFERELNDDFFDRQRARNCP